MLGSPSEADDAVQEAWVRFSRADTSGVANLGGWLTTTVARTCLDILRSRRLRREDPLDPRVHDPHLGQAAGLDPEHEALIADALGPALIVVLDTLTPAERAAFVLHDMFAMPFDDIAPILERSPSAARQLASRARRRVRHADRAPDPDQARQRALVDAFLAASRDGDFDALLAVLDPDVVLRADHAAVRAGAAPEVRGAVAVAETFRGRARGARLALVNGAVGAVWAPGGQPRVIFGFTLEGGSIVGIELVAEADRLHDADLTWLDR